MVWLSKTKLLRLGSGLVGLISDTAVHELWPPGRKSCVTLLSTLMFSPLSTFCLWKVSWAVIVIQVIWYWLHYWYIKVPCIFAWHQRVSFASGWDAKGRNKTSTSDKPGMSGVRRYVGDLTWSHNCPPRFKWWYPSATPLLCLQHHQYAATTFSV